MIHIQKVHSLGAAAPVALGIVAGEYYNYLRYKYRNPTVTALAAAIGKRSAARAGAKEKQRRLLSWLKSNYKRIIVADAAELATLMAKVEKNQWDKLMYDGRKQTSFGKEVEGMFGYGRKPFKSVRSWLAGKLNIKSCPYCAAQYTLLVKDTTKKEVIKLQFDHFFPRKRHPWLSISFYNLIPSCANCNLAKGDKPTTLAQHYHPYHAALTDRAYFHVEWNKLDLTSTVPEIKKLKPEDISVALKSKLPDAASQKFAEEHDARFDITGIYERHKDIAHDLLIRAALYTQQYKHAVRSIKHLFPSKAALMHYVLGNYMEKGRILDRPLTKFSQDMAERLGLIDPQ